MSTGRRPLATPTGGGGLRVVALVFSRSRCSFRGDGGDDRSLWPTSYAMTELTDAGSAAMRELYVRFHEIPDALMRRDQYELGGGTIVAYGHHGRPFLVFPSEQGRAWDFESNGMIDAVRPLLDDGRVKLYCVDSFDAASWTDRGLSEGREWISRVQNRRNRRWREWERGRRALLAGRSWPLRIGPGKDSSKGIVP